MTGFGASRCVVLGTVSLGSRKSVPDSVAGAATDNVIELSLAHFADINDVLIRASENAAERSVTINVGFDAPLVVLEDVALIDFHADDFRFV
ncbi:MAG: hypothetical protein K5905_13760 [Roseibium sp.]|uniref:hypothetical protein n=1 Tax=Roseibium sp. TaxID=1936156 RepID=UPI00260E9235|nr:hypothetical protein [Roseibium sp.]MCV0426530.1 hypothetical protein [Roseibium sp.]